MLQHIVAWKFKQDFSNEENLQNAQKIKSSLENLKSLIKEIVEIKVFINPIETSDKNVMLFSTFKNQADLDIYQEHPEHLKVKSIVQQAL
ncbi:MAG: Dabb family protein, partial [Oscillospiraceae bacterium]